MSPKSDTEAEFAAADAEIGTALGFAAELKQLQSSIARWVDERNQEMDDCLKWQFTGKSKYFRPVTVFACFSAMNNKPIGAEEQTSALVIELIHNMTLIIDDILDKSEYRRGKLTLHCKFGLLPALMTAGYIVSEAYRIVRSRPGSIALCLSS
ncbi:polyprenyl synthetase family protein [Bradyrhizobium sp. RDI18]|uniref:polyprenyl synthetase family protein n=1 Tax=Bradyrhizobium sp. RDI18 TaxID=3367400 RepID=UPI00371E2338